MVIVIIIVALLLLVGLIYVLVRNSIISLATSASTRPGAASTCSSSAGTTWSRTWSSRSRATPRTSRETFEKVTQARAAAMQASGPEEAGKAETQLTAALGGLRVVAEQYPELRATENFQQLQRQLSELEDEIQASRRIYNSNVQQYNTRIQQFPASIVANQGGFTAKHVLRDRRRRRARGPAGLLHRVELEPARTEAALARGSTRRARRPVSGWRWRSGPAAAARSGRPGRSGTRWSGRC